MATHKMTHAPLTPEELARLEALEKAATPGRWLWGRSGTVEAGDGAEVCTGLTNRKYRLSENDIIANMALIGEFRNAAPRLLAELIAARARIGELESGLAPFADEWRAAAEHWKVSDDCDVYDQCYQVHMTYEPCRRAACLLHPDQPAQEAQK